MKILVTAWKFIKKFIATLDILITFIWWLGDVFSNVVVSIDKLHFQFLSYKYFKQLSLVTVPYFCFGFSSLPQESFPCNVLFAERKWFLDSLASFFFIFLLDGIQLVTWSISLFFYLVWWLVNVVEGIRVNFLC